jgi:hypothetical protein
VNDTLERTLGKDFLAMTIIRELNGPTEEVEGTRCSNTNRVQKMKCGVRDVDRAQVASTGHSPLSTVQY